VNEQERLDDFKKFLGSYAVERKHISHLKRDLKTAPDSEITVDQGFDKNGRKHKN
jgi:hypothetical protein